MVACKAETVVCGPLHNGHTVGGERLGIGVGALQRGVQDAVVAALQRVVAVGLVEEPDLDIQAVQLGFQCRVGGQGAVHRVRFLRFNAVLGVIAGRVPLADCQGQQRCRADDAERERRTQHGEPVKFHLHVGPGAVDEHLDAQRNEDDRGEFQNFQQVELRHKLIDDQQNTGCNQHQRKCNAADAADLFRGGLFIHDFTSFYLY